MKIIHLSAACCLLFAFAALQSNAQVPLPASGDNGKVFTMVEEMPQFPGGEDAMKKFLAENIKYPEQALKDSVKGKVYIGFVVGTDGRIKEAKVLRGIGAGCDEEALRVVNMMPAWTPGKQNGKPVSVQFNLPVNFILKGKKAEGKSAEDPVLKHY